MRRWQARSSSEPLHIPVLADEVVKYLSSCPPGVFVDATIGEGGHSAKIYRVFGDRFQYLGFDLDQEAIAKAKVFFAESGFNIELVNLNFTDIARYLGMRGISAVSAVLYDLGPSTFQLEDPDRGFSYLRDGPLQLSFDRRKRYAIRRWLATASESELTQVIKMYGEERRARAIAKAIKRAPQKITTTGQLAALVRDTVGDRFFVKTAARVFQALRIKINDELGNLSRSLESIIPLLQPQGKVIVISYHSLEDGLVKRQFRKFSGRCVCAPNLPDCACGKKQLLRVLTTKPIVPTAAEIANNKRARSAKMRVAERIALPA